jgi:hypothetical protein
MRKEVTTMSKELFWKRQDFDEGSLRGGDNIRPSGGRETWNDLPIEARRECSKLMAEIPGYTREKYMKDFFEGE